jgi:signal transduction histidine kinase
MSPEAARGGDEHAAREAAERFVQDAAHELRTPVTIARGHLELLRAETGTSLALEVALDELWRMDAIIDRLLTLSGAGRRDFLVLGEVDLEVLLEDVFMRWSGLAPRAWKLGELAAGTLVADAERLRTALDALIENAVKYTRPHDGIELRAAPAGEAHVEIQIIDEGCGVPAEALRRIFERFARAEPARRSSGGAGLGLTIVDAIAKAHGGSCDVRSTSAGSVFSLRLPNFGPDPATAGGGGADEPLSDAAIGLA